MTKVLNKMKVLMAGCFALSGMSYILTSLNMGFLNRIPDWPFWYLGLFSTMVLFSLFALYGLLSMYQRVLNPVTGNTYQLKTPSKNTGEIEPSSAWPGSRHAA